MIKKLLLLILAIGLCSSVCYGAPHYNNWGNTDTNRLLGQTVPYYMTALGLAKDGVSDGCSQMVSGSTAIPADVLMAQKYIGATGQVGTIDDGVAGQVLFFRIDTCDTGATFVLTPTNCWGFSTLTFNAVNDSAVLLYLNDVYGWVLIGSNSVTVA
jgi:hypothetical protein